MNVLIVKVLGKVGPEPEPEAAVADGVATTATLVGVVAAEAAVVAAAEGLGAAEEDAGF